MGSPSAASSLSHLPCPPPGDSPAPCPRQPVLSPSQGAPYTRAAASGSSDTRLPGAGPHRSLTQLPRADPSGRPAGCPGLLLSPFQALSSSSSFPDPPPLTATTESSHPSSLPPVVPCSQHLGPAPLLLVLGKADALSLRAGLAGSGGSPYPLFPLSLPRSRNPSRRPLGGRAFRPLGWGAAPGRVLAVTVWLWSVWSGPGGDRRGPCCSRSPPSGKALRHRGSTCPPCKLREGRVSRNDSDSLKLGCYAGKSENARQRPRSVVYIESLHSETQPGTSLVEK